MCTVSIHRSITFDYFERDQPIADLWACRVASAQADEETHSFEETTFFVSFQVNDSQKGFRHGYMMAISY